MCIASFFVCEYRTRTATYLVAWQYAMEHNADIITIEYDGVILGYNVVAGV